MHGVFTMEKVSMDKYNPAIKVVRTHLSSIISSY